MRGRDVVAGLAVLLAAVIVAVVSISSQMDGTLSPHGWTAFGLGVGVTLLLAAGLMTLVFVSHHRGYDDDAGHP